MKYLIPAILLLTACATSPTAMRESGKTFATLTLEGEVDPIAQCTRTTLINDPPNALNPPTPILAQRGAGVSVVGQASDGTVYLADLIPANGNVRATVYVSYAYAHAMNNGEAVVEALKGCG